MAPETVQRIEPARPEEATEALADVIADLVAAATKLGRALHPRTAAHLADLVRIANIYYSNLIEGHNTRPKEYYFRACSPKLLRVNSAMP